ncbi:NAD-P-binding protein [Amylostereum chailletii]|nr:NAD-P-binding protein [Amylostereum chailletii]
MANKQTAFRLTKQGAGPQGILKVQNPIPKPGPHEVLVRIHAVTLNYRDVALTIGRYISMTQENFVLGSDMGGEIVAVGSSATRFKKGDRVANTVDQRDIYNRDISQMRASTLGGPLDGVLQEYRVFDERYLLSIPEHLSYEEASCFPGAGLTAWTTLFEGRQLVPGETVVSQGTGSVSIAALSLAHAAGATTIVTSSSDEKLLVPVVFSSRIGVQLAKKLGATHTINYRTTPDWDKAVNELTKGKGANHIIDNVGISEIERCFNCVAQGGVISNVGFLGGQPKVYPDVPMLCLLRGATMRGIYLGPVEENERMFRFVEQKQLRPYICKVFPFEQTVEAIQYLESGAHFGKVVVRVSSP